MLGPIAGLIITDTLARRFAAVMDDMLRDRTLFNA
jgi:hypothetical protein